jgi:peptidoglycan/xylan/chitin deacetylase (PgdA/CDA1 family)
LARAHDESLAEEARDTLGQRHGVVPQPLVERVRKEIGESLEVGQSDLQSVSHRVFLDEDLGDRGGGHRLGDDDGVRRHDRRVQADKETQSDSKWKFHWTKPERIRPCKEHSLPRRRRRVKGGVNFVSMMPRNDDPGETATGSRLRSGVALGSILGVALLVGMVSSHPRAAEPHAAAFIYHRFGENRHPSTSVTLEQFDAHLSHLAEAGYRVLPLAEIVSAISKGKTLPDRTVAITIDDAYDSIFTEAFPRLRERGWPFTVFACTDPVDQKLRGYLTWDRMREMKEHGATFANHTATHDSLVERRPGESEEAWAKRVRTDIDLAQRRLKEELGSAPMLFAYPYGEYDETLANLVAEMGYVAWGQQSGALGSGSDPRSLPRYAMAEEFADLDDFKVKAASLPLAVVSVDPWDPLTSSRRPRLEIELGSSDARLAQLACFVGGQGQVDVEWLEPERRFAVQAARDLPDGRNRYNCTAPNADGSRYYWFSQQWLVRAVDPE